jgi:RNA polymerase sigma factor (sigma-70 family)
LSVNDSVAHWLRGIREGDGAAAQRLWERYFDRLVALAKQKLPPHAKRAFDEEDVALSAFQSFHEATSAGRYPQLGDRAGLWNMLVVITARKAKSYSRREMRQKRGGGGVRGDSGFAPADDAGIDQVIGDEPTPEFASQVAEEYQRLLQQLDDDELRTIAVRKMEGFTSDEIAEQLGCARRTVERRLTMIRTRWQESAAADEPE